MRTVWWVYNMLNLDSLLFVVVLITVLVTGQIDLVEMNFKMILNKINTSALETLVLLLKYEAFTCWKWLWRYIVVSYIIGENNF